MSFANILPNFSWVQWTIIVIILFFCIQIVYSDTTIRRISNIHIVGILIFGIFWNLIGQIVPQQDNLLQMLFILIGGYIIHSSGVIGGGDIKLIVILSLFFLSYRSPFIFLGNIAVITIVFLSGYIIGNIISLKKNSDLKKEIITHLRETWRKNTLLRALRNFQEPTPNDKKEYKKILGTLGAWVSIMLMISLIRYNIHQYLLVFIPWASILATGTGTVLLFFGLSPLLKRAYYGKYKESALLVSVIFLALTFIFTSKSNTIILLMDNIIGTMGAMIFMGLLYSIFRGIYSFLLIFFDRQCIEIQDIRLGHTFNIVGSNFLYKTLSGNDIFSFKKVETPLVSLTPKRLSELVAIKERYPYISLVYIQRTLPYAIFIIGGFFITCFTQVHLAGELMQLFQ